MKKSKQNKCGCGFVKPRIRNKGMSDSLGRDIGKLEVNDNLFDLIQSQTGIPHHVVGKDNVMLWCIVCQRDTLHSVSEKTQHLGQTMVHRKCKECGQGIRTDESQILNPNMFV